jgi:hypothetical protein
MGNRGIMGSYMLISMDTMKEMDIHKLDEHIVIEAKQSLYCLWKKIGLKNG